MSHLREVLRYLQTRSPEMARQAWIHQAVTHTWSIRSASDGYFSIDAASQIRGRFRCCAYHMMLPCMPTVMRSSLSRVSKYVYCWSPST
ncbi:hypothetical protein LX32DRAFT_255313 [Colletotrichum zoysiae]|uniref:Uncharacterized protein n=1 Tax=Colletotrichum zoysiae TaxID=1216348 RepID=A0AAD9M6I4_9PEZI|nr:hypothetical protein LX32DRAFT_255313 [Colletotrichum zoysiae]